ncbi:hypothetical protein L211DRAFT_673598 [Terfezia boudieri ATCC MYA-4762]|uniref:Uncharacterized protein n=1 Tax=Terfezia boudieri ATCC MYA-4762 TaxID=1051890 RepID=A0A3N4L7V7_9PEZI|nr:hypothetical protein L211DRAFT_673598 [Terfezia boudieri ATCC MYA-4762]
MRIFFADIASRVSQTSRDSNYPLGNLTNLTANQSESCARYSRPPELSPEVPDHARWQFVAVKYAWRSADRVSEAALYLLATPRGVRSLSPILRWNYDLRGRYQSIGVIHIYERDLYSLIDLIDIYSDHS